MEEIEVSKKVFFIGAWRTQAVTDQLLRQISQQMSSKKGYTTTLTLKAEGLELFILNSEGMVTRTDKIPLQNIVDFTDNKYKSTCVLSIVKDKQSYTVFVFVCSCERDAADMVQGFGKIKKRLSGEGYNFDLKPKGMNWTLKTKQETLADESSEHDNVRVITSGPYNGNTHQGSGVVTVVGAPNGENHYRVLKTSSNDDGHVRVITNDGVQNEVRVVHPHSLDQDTVSNPSELHGELQHLADEVRDIKVMLQKSQGRHHFEKHYGYRIAQGMPAKTETVVENVTVRSQPQYEIKASAGRNQSLYVRNQNTEPRTVILRTSSDRSNGSTTKGGHYVSTSSISSSTPSGYSKRVYESPNPALEQGLYLKKSHRQMHRHVIPTTQRRIYVPRDRRTHSVSSDIVHKNIEDVYKSRSLKRHVIPVAVGHHKAADYVESHQLHSPPLTPPTVMVTTPQQFPSTVVTKHVNRESNHVRYDPEVRGYYESNTNDVDANDVEVIHTENTQNVSKIVNVSSFDNYDDEEKRYVERSDDNVTFVRREDENVTYINSNSDIGKTQDYSEHGDNIIVIRAETDNIVNAAPSTSEDENIIRITSQERYSTHYDEPQVIGGAVYHVKAGGIETISNGYNNEYGEENVVFIDSKRELETNGIHEKDGLWGNYTSRPEGEESGVTIIKQTAYRYHDDDEENEDKNSDKKSDTDGERESREIKHVRYNDNIEETIPDIVNVNENESDKNDIDNDSGNDDDLNNNDSNKNADESENEEDEKPYVINEEELRAFREGPTVIIVDKEEQRVIKTGDTVSHVVNGEVSDIVYEAENTVLF